MPSIAGWYWAGAEPEMRTPPAAAPPADPGLPLGERLATGNVDLGRGLDASPGRRLRVFATLVSCYQGDVRRGGVVLATDAEGLTFAQVLARAEADPRLRAEFERLPLTETAALVAYRSIPDGYEAVGRSDAALHAALQDLGDEINEDVREACYAFDDPDLWYPGVDEGIEPVPDEHVELVVWALGRELQRELRDRDGGGSRQSAGALPAAPLERLPWPVKRALAERRRWHYGRYGIDSAAWERGVWSLWDVAEDADWRPRRALRMGGLT